MRTSLLCLALGLGIAILGGPFSTAQEPKARPFNAEFIFRFGDTNKDGKLLLEEFKAIAARNPKTKENPAITARLFEALDTDKNGSLTLAELQKMPQILGGGKKQEPMAPPPASAKGSSAFNDRPTAEQAAFFEKKIRPALIEHCYKCHSKDAEKLKGGLILDSKDGTRAGGESGPAIVPGNPDRSMLITAIRHKDDRTAMPPKQKLPDTVIADFETWVRAGAPDPREDGGAAPKTHGLTADEIAKGRQHWAFQPLKSVPAPAVKDRGWATSDLDRFVLAKLEAKGIKPVGEADKRMLIRRVTIDLTGLLPTSDEVEAFVADHSPDAFVKVVDRLLASPAFGERWGRHWMDVARFTESSGKTANFNYPHAWRFRDYAIAAFNKDKPYDQFVREQIAGDLMTGGDDRAKSERIVATGFLALGPKALNERNATQFQMDVIDEQIDTVTQAFLGVTVACARCHDHKFDPIPQKEYYALAGIFRSTETCYGTVRFVQSQRPSDLIELPKNSAPSAIEKTLSTTGRTDLEKTVKDLRKKLSENNGADPVTNIFTFSQMNLTQAKLDQYDADGKPKLMAMGARERFRPSNSPMYVRGDVDKPGDVVPRSVPHIVSDSVPAIGSGSGRKELADWLVARDNPLTSRVMVNRVWAHLFGRGLVPTLDNFGLAGQSPSHPELLDHLALEFMKDGWSVKRLIRRMVLSHAYQLDSHQDAAAFEADPDNVLLWRMSPRRVEAEVLRDAILQVSGQLDGKAPIGSPVARAGEGPSFRPRLGSLVETQGPDNHRSVYLALVVDNLPESLELFDGANPGNVVASRSSTNVPTQGLFMLNNSFVMNAADEAAMKLLKETTTTSERVRAAYLKFYGRPPVEKELQAAEAFISQYRVAAIKDRTPSFRVERSAWSAFCQALIASAEFQYRR